MRLLLTAGGTREPIDPVRYLGNRSSGRVGAAVASAAVAGGHDVTLVVGPGAVEMPAVGRRVDVGTAAEMLEAVTSNFGGCDLLVMAAAVADYRPIAVNGAAVGADKVPSGAGRLTIECEPTADVLEAVGRVKRADQRTVGFSLQSDGDLAKARAKLACKNLDLIVFNRPDTLDAGGIDATLLYADGRAEGLGYRTKADFADVLLGRCLALFA